MIYSESGSFPPSVCIGWTGEKNAVLTVWVRSSDSALQTSSGKRGQNALSFMGIRGHMLISYSKQILRRTRESEGSLEGCSNSTISTCVLNLLNSRFPLKNALSFLQLRKKTFTRTEKYFHSVQQYLIYSVSVCYST